MIEDAGDFLGGIEPAAVGVHVENDRARPGAFRRFLGPAQEDRERRRNLAVQRHDHDIAPADGVPLLAPNDK